MSNASRFPSTNSLSTKLLLLTIIFVFVAELVVLVPSVSNFRLNWFAERIETAYLVSLALDGSNQEMIAEDIALNIFETANILGVTVQKGSKKVLVLAPDINPHGPQTLQTTDLNNQSIGEIVYAPWAALFSSGNDYIRVMGTPRHASSGMADLLVSEQALRTDMIVYLRNIFILSLFISVLTAALVYWALARMIVRPVRILTENMTVFESDPENIGNILIPSTRTDEVGTAEQTLARMELRTQSLLHERRRLAGLGAGIAKISHDLRNILSSVQLMSDRLRRSDDPRVKELSPRLVSALDRAIALSRDTLAFGRMEASVLVKEQTNLYEMTNDVFDNAAAFGISFENDVIDGFMVHADKTHLYRAIFNLVKNSVDAMTPTDMRLPEGAEKEPDYGTVEINAKYDGKRALIYVSCLLYTSPSPRDRTRSRMPSSA